METTRQATPATLRDTQHVLSLRVRLFTAIVALVFSTLVRAPAGKKHYTEKEQLSSFTDLGTLGGGHKASPTLGILAGPALFKYRAFRIKHHVRQNSFLLNSEGTTRSDSAHHCSTIDRDGLSGNEG